MLPKRLTPLFLLMVVLTTAVVSDLTAQTPTKLNLYLRAMLQDPEFRSQDLHLLVKGDKHEILTYTLESGGTYKYNFRDYSAILLPATHLADFAEMPYVDRIEYNMGKGQPLLNQSLINSNIGPVHAGMGGLPQGYDGEGVIMGVIDSGIDFNHPDFQDSLGNTRIIELWDHNLSGNQSLQPSYGYGQLYDSAMINAGQCPSVDQAQWFGHGSNVTGIAAGNGQAANAYVGAAPKADLVIVSSNFGAGNWTATIADAVDYIFKVADSLDRPCVINASLGTYYGSHDGFDAPAQIIDGLLDAKPGRVMVAAAGNSGNWDPYHLGYNVTSDTNFTWFEYNPSAFGFGAAYWEVFADTADFNNVMFSVGADKVTGGYSFRGRIEFDNIQNRLNALISDTIMNNGNIIAIVQTWAQETDGVYFMQCMLAQPDSNQYNFRFETTGSGRFDVWAADWVGTSNIVGDSLPTVAQYPAMAHYKAPDLRKSIVTSWTCSDHVITVANYINRDEYLDVDSNLVTFSDPAGTISDDSSWGPNRQEQQKPDIAAPGGITLSSGKLDHLANMLANVSLRPRVGLGGWHYRNGGTSMASPGVAGIAALYLQKCPKASWSEIKQAITTTAATDSLTGSAPNERWGFGKADGFEALLTSNFNDSLMTSTGLMGFCPGESVTLTMNNGHYQYSWSNGDTNAATAANVAGDYSAIVTNTSGCKGYTDTLTIQEFTSPPAQTVVPDGPTEFCEGGSVGLSVNTGFDGYGWSTGDSVAAITVSDSGDYFVEITDGNGCTNGSDTVTITFLPDPVTPLVVQTGNILSTGNNYTTYQWYHNSFPIAGATGLGVTISQSGAYYVLVTNAEGCSTTSAISDVFFTGVESVEPGENLNIYPQPTRGDLTVDWSAGNQAPSLIQLLDPAGRTVRRWNLESSSSGQQFQLSLSGLSTGVYLMQVKIGDNYSLHKIVYQ